MAEAFLLWQKTGNGRFFVEIQIVSNDMEKG